MAKTDSIVMEGIVAEVLPAQHYRIAVEGRSSVLAYVGGNLKKGRLRFVLGDRVRLEMSPYDLTKGRITGWPE